MQVTFNKRSIYPSVFRGQNKKGEDVSYLSTTLLSPQKYSLIPAQGVMPIEQIQAVLEHAADNAEEVEIEFIEQQTKFGSQMQVFSVKPISKQPIK